MKVAQVPPPGSKSKTDIVIIGAGFIGLAIALEMHDRGAAVTVVERDQLLGQASVAAAGMLAVDDPHNPAALLEFSRLSARLYPEFLQRLEKLSGMPVPFQTEATIQHGADGTAIKLAERSIDPRQMAAALQTAVSVTSIRVLEQTSVVWVKEDAEGVRLRAADGSEILAEDVVYASGAWGADVGQSVALAPRKGQMLRVRLPERIMPREVHRNQRVYVVPRSIGPQAGTALIGATVEDAGFDTVVHAGDLTRLREFAAEMLPEIASELASETDAPMVEAWAGLRPATPDLLPVLGPLREGPHRYIAGGHYRNGVLLAPATAMVMADLLTGKGASIDLAAFAPDRFSR